MPTRPVTGSLRSGSKRATDSSFRCGGMTQPEFGQATRYMTEHFDGRSRTHKRGWRKGGDGRK
jgi:hypothetical protein